MNTDGISEYEKEMLDKYYYIIETVASILSARKKMPPTMDYNDLLSAGFTGLIKAVRKFSTKKNVEFKTYANIRVRGEMMDLIRKEWTAKNPKSNQLFQAKIRARIDEAMTSVLNEPGKVNVTNLLSLSSASYVISLDAVTDDQSDKIDSKEILTEEKLEKESEYEGLNSIVETLEKDELFFVNLFYRLGATQKDIAAQLNISESKASRMHVDILKKLKRKIELKTCV